MYDEMRGAFSSYRSMLLQKVRRRGVQNCRTRITTLSWLARCALYLISRSLSSFSATTPILRTVKSLP
jgi:hypothetical protein